MDLLRDLSLSIAGFLWILLIVWPVPAQPPELIAPTFASSSAMQELMTDSNDQPTELSIVTLVNHRQVLRKSEPMADAAPSVVTESVNPILQTAPDGSAIEVGPTEKEFSSQPIELAVIAPPKEQIFKPLGHQAADAALSAAVELGTLEEMAQASPLEPPAPTLFAEINLTTQRMTVSDKLGVLHTWKISSARRGYVTPVGDYKPQWTSRMHYSRQYYNSPMPYSVFFHRGYAVHGTTAVGRLGYPASHGCVRLRTSNAKKFYNLVHKHGKGLTKITVRGTRPASPKVARDYRPRRRYRARKRVRRRTYQTAGFFSAYSYRPPRRRYYRRRRYRGY